MISNQRRSSVSDRRRGEVAVGTADEWPTWTFPRSTAAATAATAAAAAAAAAAVHRSARAPRGVLDGRRAADSRAPSLPINAPACHLPPLNARTVRLLPLWHSFTQTVTYFPIRYRYRILRPEQWISFRKSQSRIEPIRAQPRRNFNLKEW